MDFPRSIDEITPEWLTRALHCIQTYEAPCRNSHLYISVQINKTQFDRSPQ